MIKNINDSLKLVRKNNNAFTIVELLIVIVIIGILAAITIVSYTGITKRAGESSVQAELSNASKKLAIYYTLNGTYPTNIDQSTGCPTAPVADNSNCIKFGSGTSFSYSFKTTSTYGLSANKGSTGYLITESSSPIAFIPSFVKTWGGASAEYGYGLVQTSDGGYAVTGYTASYGAGGNDMFIAKYDASGNLSWNKTWGGANNEEGFSLIQTRDGGYAVTGHTYSYGAGNTDLFLVKYDANGNVGWNKVWGGTNFEQGYSLIQTNDDGYVITSYTTSYGAGGSDMFIAKYDASGNLSWNKVWGGTGSDSGNDVIQTIDGGYAVTGYTGSYGAGSNDAFLAKYDASGNLSWNKLWGGTGDDRGYGLVQDSDGSYAVTGYTGSYGAGSNDAFLAKYDASGNLSWNKLWGGTGTEISENITKTSDGGYAIMGAETSFGAGGWDIFLVNYSASGSVVWNRTWGGSSTEYGYGEGLVQTIDGGFAFLGYSNSYGAGGYDSVIIKTNANGVINNCSSPMCQSPTATITTPTATVNTPTATVTTPTATITTPTATVNTPTATVTTVVAP